MAVKKNYEIELSLASNITSIKELYSEILSEEQLAELEVISNKKVTVYDAYFRIETIQGSKQNVTMSVCIYDSSATRLIANQTFSFVPSVYPNSENFIKQGYEYLKTLPEFEGAVDVLEEDQIS